MRACSGERQNVNCLGMILTRFGCMSVVCVCAALPAGPGLPGGPANGCMKKDHAWNWNIRMCMHTVD